MDGVMVGVQTKGHSATRLTLRDISRGGAALVCDWTLAPGTPIELELPQADGPVPARVVRCDGGALAVVFSSEPHALVRIDRALAALTQRRRAA